jgi:hypothetical protein
MKSKALIAGLAAFSLTSMSYAVTVDVTGATAFRAATLLAIKAQFTQSGVAFQYAHDQAAGNLNTAAPGATRAIFKGTIRNATNTANIPNVTVRCSFNGSVEGINALVNNVNPTYYTDSSANLVTAAAIGGGETHTSTASFQKTVEPGISEIAFSDVSKDSTPYAALPILGGPVGVVVFTMLGSEGTTFTNVTDQQFRALMGAGFQPLSLFSGVEADSPLDPAGNGVGPNAAWVFATGRNDGSGTRTTYLAETGYGVSKKVKQYVTNTSSSTALNTIQLVPFAGVATPPQTALTGQIAGNASSIWTQNTGLGNDGNGGYSSGSTLRTDMGKTGGAVTVYDENGDDAFGGPQKLTLVTWLSLNDATTARTNGAVFLGYNGEKLDVTADTNTAMTATDIAKVTEGRYTAWGFQQMYLDSTIDGVNGDPAIAAEEVLQKQVYDTLFVSVQTNLGIAGLPVSAMHVGRPTDGGVVAP